MSELPPELRRLLDRQEIQDVIARYALGQDAHQGDDCNLLREWNEVFTPDAITDYSAAGAPVCSYRELAVWMRGDHERVGRMSSFSNWQHMLGLPTITVEGDSARARTDYFATHRGRSSWVNCHFNAAGAFHDELVHSEQGWRIRYRRLEVYFADALPVLAIPASS
jgi:hypothetical protein